LGDQKVEQIYMNNDQYYVIGAQGVKHGPATLTQLTEWEAQGRVVADTVVERVSDGVRMRSSVLLRQHKTETPPPVIVPRSVTNDAPPLVQPQQNVVDLTKGESKSSLIPARNKKLLSAIACILAGLLFSGPGVTIAVDHFAMEFNGKKVNAIVTDVNTTQTTSMYRGRAHTSKNHLVTYSYSVDSKTYEDSFSPSKKEYKWLDEVEIRYLSSDPSKSEVISEQGFFNTWGLLIFGILAFAVGIIQLAEYSKISTSDQPN
jgi:hypothetical protein